MVDTIGETTAPMAGVAFAMACTELRVVRRFYRDCSICEITLNTVYQVLSSYSNKRDDNSSKRCDGRGAEGCRVFNEALKLSLEGIKGSRNSVEVVCHSPNIDGTRCSDLVIYKEKN